MLDSGAGETSADHRPDCERSLAAVHHPGILKTCLDNVNLHYKNRR